MLEDTNSLDGAHMEVILVLMLEQRIMKHTLNSVPEISETDTFFHHVLSKTYPFSLCSHQKGSFSH